MADSYVCSGAMMKCTMGTSPATLTVLPDRMVFLAGQLMANIGDNKPMANLAPFGLCRSLGFPATASATAAALGTLTPMPCMHNTPAPWIGGKTDYLIKGQPALLKSCTCQCMWGGTISLINNGQVGEGAQGVNQTHRDRMKEISSSSSAEFRGGFMENIVEKNEKAAQYRAEGMGFFQSLFKANRDVDFKNSRNKQGWMSDNDADDKKSNKRYKQNSQFRMNCATTTATFFIRKKGYDVTARPLNANSHTDSISYGLNYYKIWKNPDGSKVSPTILLDKFNAKIKEKKLQNDWAEIISLKEELLRIKDSIKESSNENEKNLLKSILKREITDYRKKREKFESVYKEILMEACKEEGYYTFGLTWDKVMYNSRHYTVIKSEKDKNGNIVLTNIEPQSGEPIGFDTLIRMLDFPPYPTDTVMRTDDKVFNEDYNDLFEIN